MKVYRAVILTILHYGCETWTICRRHEKLLQRFHLRCLRNIFNIYWQDKIPDTEILERADLPIIITIYANLRLDAQDTLVVCQTAG